MTAAARAVLDYVATANESRTTPDGLARATGLDRDDLLDALRELAEARLVRIDRRAQRLVIEVARPPGV